MQKVLSGAKTHPVDRLLGALGSPAAAAGALVGLNGFYILLVAFGNITDFDTNLFFVRHVLAMDTTNFGAQAGTDLDSDVMWRAVNGSGLQLWGYIGAIVWESTTAVVLLVAAALWCSPSSAGRVRARALSTLGLLMLLVLFMGGFISVGGEWFQMWRSTAWNGLDPAFRNSVLALATLIFIHLKQAPWRGASGDTNSGRRVRSR